MFLAVVRAQHTIAVAACKQKKKNRQEVGIIIQVMVAGVADVSMCKQLYEELICVRYTFWTEVRFSRSRSQVTRSCWVHL